jgi:glucose uptake protein
LYQPETYGVALTFMVATMLCWGSWANTLKLCPGYRFQLFYWDYVVGLLFGSVVWGLTLGSVGSTGSSFVKDITASGIDSVLWAMAGGAVFNVANLLLVAAIDIAGLAVAFPVGIGLALVIGAVSSYVMSPNGNPWMLFGGIALVVGAILCDAIAYRLREATRASLSTRGVVISLISGVLMGSFFPLVSKAMSGVHGPGPYATCFFFAIGVAICAVPVNLLLMRRPLDQAAGSDAGVLVSSTGMAHGGGAGRGNLVYGRGAELCGFASAGGGAGGVVLDWAGRNDGFGLLGSVCVARICGRSGEGEDLPWVDVRAVCVRAGAGGFGTFVLSRMRGMDGAEIDCSGGQHQHGPGGDSREDSASGRDYFG